MDCLKQCNHTHTHAHTHFYQHSEQFLALQQKTRFFQVYSNSHVSLCSSWSLVIRPSSAFEHLLFYFLFLFHNLVHSSSQTYVVCPTNQVVSITNRPICVSFSQTEDGGRATHKKQLFFLPHLTELLVLLNSSLHLYRFLLTWCELKTC